MTVISFILFLLLFIIVGVASAFKRKKTQQDYLLAGQQVSPSFVALSAVATNNSAYMFIGMIGFTYLVGISSIWLMIGWITGDFLSSLFIHKKLRINTEISKSVGYAEMLSKWHQTDYVWLRLLGNIITLLFLGTYAAAQFKAGSKALHVLFGWNYSSGAIIGSIIVLLYCFAGGIRASIWTDVAQSIVMIAAMGLLLAIAVFEIGGLSSLWQQLSHVSPNYLGLFPQNLYFDNFSGKILFVIGWLFAGFGVIGQPHIMVRFMALSEAKKIKQVRYYYYSWYIVFFMMTILVGLVARIMIPNINHFDAELALPKLAMQLMPDFLVGLVLAGLFAATMSTADSQILCCTAALAKDVVPKKYQNYIIAKIITVFVTLIALAIALYGHKNVFQLVLISWSALGSAFAPLLTVYALKQKIPELVAVLMMSCGVGTMLLWRYFGLGDSIYEILPGILSGFLIFAVYKLFRFNA